MAFLTVRQAAEQVGVSRQTMFRKIKEGKVSAVKDRDGQLQIDTAELLRVFGGLQSPTVSDTTAGDRPRVSPKTEETHATVAQQIEIERLRAQLELKTAELVMTRERLDEAKAREQAAKEERDKLFGILEQQTRLLAGPPAPMPAVPEAKPSKKSARKSGKGGGKKAQEKQAQEEPQQQTVGFGWPFWLRPS